MILPSKSTSKENSILSPQDEKLFDSFLVRNKSFVLKLKSKSTVSQQQFPLYFGTTEDEINPHRKMALRKKRLAKDIHYNTPESLQNQRCIKKNVASASTESSTGQTSVSSTSASGSNTTTPLSSTPSSSTDLGSTTAQTSTLTAEPTLASQLISKPESKEQKKSTKKPTKQTTPPPATSADSVLKPAPIPKTSTGGGAGLSFADSIKLSQAKPSTSSPVPSSASRSKSSSKSATQSPAPSSTPTFDTVSTVFSPALSSSLGITLLRIMFDSQYNNEIFHPTNSQSVIHPHGLQNSGNICYMNSILQFLFYCDPFFQMLNIIRQTTIKELDGSKDTTPILNALIDLQDLFKVSSESASSKPTNNTQVKYDTINPDKFYSSISSLPRFSHLSWGRQEDAEEFLNILLDGLHEEFVESIKSLPLTEVHRFANSFSNKETARKIIQNVDFIKDASKENASALESDSWNEVGSNMKTIGKRTCQVKLSPIVNLFGGQFKSVLKTPNKKSSITLDPFMQVQLEISDPETTDLITAFEKFSQDEEVSLGSNTAKKQNFIDKLPSILIIHLKRFSFVANDEFDAENGEYEIVSSNKKNKKSQQAKQQQPKTKAKSKPFDGRIEKIHKFIKYDHELTLPKSCISNMLTEEPNYKLLGVVYHHGRSTENGHYTADVLTKKNEWIRLDDINVTNIRADDAIADQNLGSNINKTAYILMYQKI